MMNQAAIFDAQSHAMTPRGRSHPLSEPPSIRVPEPSPPPVLRTAKMPVNILATAFDQGLDSIPYGWAGLKFASVCAVLYVLKWFFNGATNGSERNMHSKVVIVTVSLSYVYA